MAMLPYLNAESASMDIIGTFGGYNHNERISAGEFYDAENLSSDLYPLLSTRNARYKKSMLNLQMSGYEILNTVSIDGKITYLVTKVASNTRTSYVVINGDWNKKYSVTLHESGGNLVPRLFVKFGTYAVLVENYTDMSSDSVYPTRQYFQTNGSNIGDGFGTPIDRHLTVETATIEPCDASGSAYAEAPPESDIAPESPKNGDMWIDTKGDTKYLRKWSAQQGQWVTVGTTFFVVKGGDFAGFKEGDTVTLQTNGTIHGSYYIEKELIDSTGLVFIGFIPSNTSKDCRATIHRMMPDVDILFESGNRLWGARFGPTKYIASERDKYGSIGLVKRTLNEIYASALGDLQNWRVYQNVSTDSYAASVGSDGEWTGGADYFGYPTFFKENCIHKVYGSYPAQYQIQVTACNGVERGSRDSLALLGSTLFYKGTDGFYAYEGGLPSLASNAIGRIKYSSAHSESDGRKLYIAAVEYSSAGVPTPEMLVYDSQTAIWHRESLESEARGIVDSTDGIVVSLADGNLYLAGGEGVSEDTVKYYAVTGIIGTDTPYKKYISRLILRLALGKGSELNISVQYDSVGDWERICSMGQTRLGTMSVPVRIKRCDHFRLRLDGVGELRLYSIAKVMTEGSDK